MGTTKVVLHLNNLKYRFGHRILDVFSPTSSEYGLVLEKEYIPPHSEIVGKRVVRSHENTGFSPTCYDVPDEIQIVEECIFYINSNGKFVVTSVTDKLYDSVNQDDHVFVRYSQGRFSKKIYIKEIKHPQST